MKKNIHPEYKEVTISCACGNVIKTRATKEFHTELCSNCHPFFTGKQKFVDAAGRVERFQTRYGKGWKDQAKNKKAAGEVAAAEVESK